MSIKFSFLSIIGHKGGVPLKFLFMLLLGLGAFEVFNFSTTQYALVDILGDLSFGGFKWASILAVAFCGIDIAGIARIFTPESGRDEPAEVWYLFGAWLLAACFNAVVTWWAVSVAIMNTTPNSFNSSDSPVQQVVPIFVAIMTLLIRFLIINTFSSAGDRLLTDSK